MPDEVNTTMNAVRFILDEMYALLASKNKSYGNSAINPMRIFSKSSTEEQILVRIDDKLSRIAHGSEFPGEDTVKDLVGYLVLLLAQRLLPPSAPTPERTQGEEKVVEEEAGNALLEIISMLTTIWTDATIDAA